MINFPFQNYDEFKEIFEIREHGNGVKSRRNSILLSLYKSRSVRQWAKSYSMYGEKILSVTTMTDMKNVCVSFMTHEYFNFKAFLYIAGRRWGSNDYYTDTCNGRTIDGDPKSIRYCRYDNDKVFKMKAGKMYRHLITNTSLGKALPEQVINWLCEELANEWGGVNLQPKYELHVDDDFERIYSPRKSKPCFGSCMTGDGQYSFYSDSVSAKAAYLTDEDGDMVARAVIFTEVHETGSDKIWRLCERQYATEGDELLKQHLVTRLISEGYIDGYKRVGADCHNSRVFIANDGSDLSNKRFWIECDLDYEDYLSYQDSFKWYDIDANRAYNYEIDHYTHKLDTTSASIEDERNYDEYHEEHTYNDVVDVCVDGRWMSCDVERLNDFVMIDGRWYHVDDIHECDECYNDFVMEDGYYSEITDEWYCCADCKMKAEKQYCKDNPDEYVWVNTNAVPVDKVFICPECGEVYCNSDLRTEHSSLLDKDFCCQTCKEDAEVAYIEEHPECDYIICDECGDVVEKVAAVQKEDGSYICLECKQFIELFNKILA